MDSFQGLCVMNALSCPLRSPAASPPHWEHLTLRETNKSHLTQLPSFCLKNRYKMPSLSIPKPEDESPPEKGTTKNNTAVKGHHPSFILPMNTSMYSFTDTPSTNIYLNLFTQYILQCRIWGYKSRWGMEIPLFSSVLHRGNKASYSSFSCQKPTGVWKYLMKNSRNKNS